MAKKIFSLAIVWALVMLAYIIMAVSMPAISDLTEQSATAMNASANMSRMPGTLEAVESYPYWGWVIPGLVGMVVTVITLKKGD